jgi:hypothetical protein
MIQVDSSWDAPRDAEICGKATFAMEVSSASMNVASVTVPAIIQGLICGFCAIDPWTPLKKITGR